jgi:murein endopeptidase
MGKVFIERLEYKHIGIYVWDGHPYAVAMVERLGVEVQDLGLGVVIIAMILVIMGIISQTLH